MDEVFCFDAAAGTHPGWKYRENQDAVLLGRQVWQRPVIRSCSGRPQLLAAVADGVAFAPCAAQASRLVLQLLPGAVQAQGGLDASAVRSIQRVAAAKAAGTPCAGMASTLAALELTPGGARIVSVGDSRIYRLREGCLQQLTVDHTIGRRLVAAGELCPEQFEQAGSLYDDLDSTLVALEAEAEFDIHSCVSDLQEGDVWLCCTDGITQAIPDPDLASLLTRTPPATAVRAILDVARSNRESDDNVSAIVSIVRVRDAQLP